MIDLIIFDLDGTLLDAYLAIYKSFNFTMRQVNAPLQNFSTVKKAVGWGDENLLKPYVKKEDLKKALFIYRAHHKQALLKYAKLKPKVRKTLSLLEAAGYKLAIASNRPYKFSRILIKNLGIDVFFDFMLCGDQVSQAKPHPEILFKIMKIFKKKSGNTLFVGDMALDVEAGNRAGVKTIAVSGGSSSIKELKTQKPYKIIKNIPELIPIIACA